MNNEFENTIDLNEQLISNKQCTFFFKMNGESMINLGIYSGDILVVDKSIKNTNEKVCVCVVNGEMIVRIVKKLDGGYLLSSGNNNISNTFLSPFDDFNIWGVVTYSIHSHK